MISRIYQIVGLKKCTPVLCCAADGGTMKTVVTLLLLCLCDPGQSDCQADCLSCSNILPKQLSFNTMVRSPQSTHTHTHTLQIAPTQNRWEKLPLCLLVLKQIKTHLDVPSIRAIKVNKWKLESEISEKQIVL